MKKITITNAYTWYNKGDAGILLGIVKTLKQLYGEDNIEINILSFTPDEDKKRYCKDKAIKKVYSNIINPHPYKHTKFGKIYAMLRVIVKAISIKIKLFFNKNKAIQNNEVLKLLNDSDIIVVCGGGFLGGKKLDSLMHLYQISINTLMNKPVILMGTSIEPIKNMFIKRKTEKVLKNVDYIFARENITYNYLKTFLSKDRFDIIPDMAFMLEDVKKNMDCVQEIKKKYNIIFGITVRNWNFPNSSNPKERMQNYMIAVKNAITQLIKKYNCCFIFIPQVIVSYANDVDTAKKIKDMLPDNLKEKFYIFENDFSPKQIKQLIWNCDYFIGTRMHSNIFATSMLKPTVAIAYEKKTNGIMETVGLQDYVLEIDTITNKEIVNKVEQCINNKGEISNRLTENIPLIRKEIFSKMENIMRGF